MNITKHKCLYLFIIFIIGNSSQACSFGPEAYFDMPSYIDPDFGASYYPELKYGRRRTFNNLLSQYAKLEYGQTDLDDNKAREISKREETEFYSLYQQGAGLFGAQKFESALEIFARLKNTCVPHKTRPDKILGRGGYSWVREASSYMIARCQLIIAQNNWNGYDESIKAVNQGMLLSADSSYQQYLKEYPEGLYANSARNIRRKIYFLSGQQSLLDQELRQVMLAQFPPSISFVPDRPINGNIVKEFNNHFRGQIDFAEDSPVLTAYAWLGPQKPNPQDLIALKARERDFSGYPGLFHYVMALGLYKLERYQELLEITAEDMRDKNKIWLSTQLLRARAYMRLDNHKSALRVFEQMHALSDEDAIDVEIAEIALNSGDGLWLYSDESPITSAKNLRAFALFGLSDSELETARNKSEITGDKRRILLYELARRYILTSRFSELTELLDKEPLPFFSPAKTIAANLAVDPRNIEALVDIGEFLYKNYITPASYFVDSSWSLWPLNPYFNLPKCEPCKDFGARTESYTPPISFFLSAVDISKLSKKKSEAEAKALHYIVLGGGWGSRVARCTWKRILHDGSVLARSKDAFVRLHKLYKSSPWAAATPYYYR